MAKFQSTPSGCPMAPLLETLNKPWTLHILWALTNHGEMRFGALRRSISGISARMLTERLRGLEEKGFVYRNYKPTIPPEVSYGLTARMLDITELLNGLHELAIKWDEEDAARLEAKKKPIRKKAA